MGNDVNLAIICFMLGFALGAAIAKKLEINKK